jgi:uncharacterized protein YcgI (DUF1989 family)
MGSHFTTQPLNMAAAECTEDAMSAKDGLNRHLPEVLRTFFKTRMTQNDHLRSERPPLRAKYFLDSESSRSALPQSKLPQLPLHLLVRKQRQT